MHNRRYPADRACRPLSIAGIGFATAIAIAGHLSALPADGATDALPTDTVGSVALSYAPPQHPGDGLHLHLDDLGTTEAVLLVTHAAFAGDPTSNQLTAEELASAIVMPLTIDAAGKVDVDGTLPIDVTLQQLRDAGLQFRVAFHDPVSQNYVVTDPVAVATDDAETPTPDTPAPAPSSTTLPPSTLASSGASAPSAETAQSQGVAASGSNSTSTTAGPPDPGPQDAQAPPSPSAGKANFGGGGASYSANKPGSVPFRLITTHSLVAATHDQPSPIQGSGH